MALELQISTQQAQANVEAAAAAIRDFISVAQQLTRSVQQIEQFAAALNGFRPISPEVVTSITAVAQAANALGGSTASIERFRGALAGIGGGGAASAAAAGINQVGAAAAGIRVGNLDALAAGMASAGRAAQSTVSPMAAAMSAASGVGTSFDKLAQGMSIAGQASVTTGSHLDVLARGMTVAGQAAAAGAPNFNNLGAAARGAGDAGEGAGHQFSVFGGILQAMVFSTAIEGFKSLVEGAAEAASAVQRLQIQIDVSTGVTGQGAKAYEHLAKRAYELGIPLSALTSSFGRFVNAMTAGGHSLDEAQRVYDNFSGVFRALGLGAGEVTRSFIAVDQVFQKGKVQSEELVRQLGQNIAALPLLAQSMGLVDDAGKPMVSTLQKMLKAGEVSSDVFIKFSDDLAKRYAPALQAASQMGTAAMGRLSTAFQVVEQRMGIAMWNALTGAINSFANVLYTAGSPVQVLATALGYIVGGVGAAFLYTVQSWLQVLGYAATIFLNVGKYIYDFGAALVSMIPQSTALTTALNAISSAVSAVVGFLGPLGVVLGTTAIAWGLFGGAVLRIWGVLSQGAGLITAALTSPLLRTGLIIGAVVGAITLLGVAAYSLFQTLSNGSSFTTNFGNNMQAVVDKVRDFGTRVTASVETVIPGLGRLDGAASDTVGSVSGLDGAATDATAALGSLKGAGDPAAETINNAATAAGQFDTSASNAAGSASQFSGNLSGSANAADNAAAAYRRAADAARAYAAAAGAASAARSSGGGGGSAGSFYYGGVVSKGGVGQKTSITKSDFLGAPHFAGGGVTPDSSGGIPSILHANEAVVPLRAGGTIPVSLVGTSAPGGGNNDGESNPLVTLLTQISQNDLVRDDLLGQHNDKLDLILGQLTTAFPKAETFYANALNVLSGIVSAIGSIQISGGGYGGGGSSGGGSGGIGGGSAGGGTADDAAAAYRELQAQIAQLQSQKNTKFFDTMQQLAIASAGNVRNGGGGLYNPTQLYADYNASDTAKQNNALDAQAAQLRAEYEAKYGKIPSGGSSGGGGSALNIAGFATGSPDASKDVDGGFMAKLHPNEAVIPLPDGRTVPVKFPDVVADDLKNIKAMLHAANRVATASYSGRTSGPANINQATKVTMHITTPDASSFRKSQPQIVADLRGQLQRAQQTSGAIKRLTEDPTKRIITRQ